MMKRNFTFLIAAAMMLLTMMATTGTMWGETVKYTITSRNTLTTTGTAPTGSSATIVETYGTSCQMTKGNSQTLTLTNYYGYSISNITLSMKSNQFGGAGKLSYSTDGGTTFTYIVGSSNAGVSFNQTAWNGSWSTSYVDISKDVTIIPESGKNLIIKIEATANSLYCQSYQLTYTSGTTCVTPTFSPVAGAVLSGSTVAISTTTDGATIYYTMGANPDDPTTSSDVYSTPIEITEATTIKAMAVKDGYNNSSIASASYTIATPLTTMQEIFDAATSTATNVYITFDNWVVSGASNTYAYVTDGTKGFIIINYEGHGFVEGNILSGTAQCSLNTNLGMARLQNFTSTADGLTVTTGGTVDFADIAMADLTAVNAGALLHYTNLLCSKVNSNYFLTDGTTTLQVYTALWSGFTNVLEDGKYYNITGVYHNFNATKEICPRRADDIVEYSGTSLSINPATAEPFTYLHNDGPSEDQLFQVTGENLTSDDIVATITSGAEYFEITDDEEYSSTVTVNSGDYISVRMKAGLAKGSYEGTLTLSSTGAENIVVNLTGTVTGVTYTIESIASNGTISFDPASPVEDGVQVTMTATPTEGYEFEANSWKFYNANTSDEVTLDVTDGNKITMPAYNLAVDATFTEKPTYAITKGVTPENSGTIETDATAWEGKEVTVLVEATNGYTFSSIVISKTGEPETTTETSGNVNDGFTFTMPGYAVTVTATFISNVFEGSFIKVTTLDDLEDDGYYILSNTKAMNSTLTSGRMGTTEVAITNNTITDPDRSIVWRLEKNGDNWKLYSEKQGKYCYINGNSTSSFAMGDAADYSFAVTRYDDGGFKFLTTHTSGRGIYQIVNEYASYAANNNPKVYLYKYTVVTERTITFNGNGGTTNTSETSYTQIVYDGVASTLTANQFAKDNSIFAGWALTEDGGIEYADQAEVTIHGDLPLYAKWNVAYTATVADNITGGTVKIDDGSEQGVTSVSVAAGTEITLTQTPDLGHVLSEWNVYKTGEPETTVTVTNNKFEMPEYNVTISATFNEAETYSLVTNVNQIVSGKHYLIASGYEGTVKAMGQQYTNNRAAVEVTLTGTTISKTEGVYEFVINGPDDNDNYIIYDVENKGYLYAASSSSNHLKNQPTNNDNGIWSFTINTETGAATVIAQGTNTNKYMRFNNSLFSCYGSGSSIQNPVYFYMKDNDTDLEFYGTEIDYTATSIPDGETITIGESSVMTVPDNFENNDPAALIIEDGGQLISNNAVQATIRRSITGYSSKGDNNGWYFIATPVDEGTTPSVDNGVLAGTYDLYYYNEPTHYWFNYKSHDGNEDPGFTQDGGKLLNGKGYLYANTVDADLSFEGATVAANAEVTIPLNYTPDLTPEGLKGFNLVGNPFTYNLTKDSDITLGEDLFSAYYRIVENQGIRATTISASPIQPGVGFMVQATGTGQNLVFNPSAKGRAVTKPSYIRIMAGNDSFMDHAYIQFGNFNTLRKYVLNDETPQVYVMNEGLDWAATILDEPVGEMPVNFKAGKSGTYTISVEPENVEVSYLHLIDNLTGANVDLLANPSYSFEANKGDNANRFRLVFKTNADVEENTATETFAYYNGSEWVINNMGDATLQVIDVMGRVLRSEQINGNTAVNLNQAAGIYMLRLVNGENVMVQKVVVR